jgi:nucleotide-binding universal stress UspA family protein
MQTKGDAMIKNVMVRLDGTFRDEGRLAAVNQIADIFESHITGLFFNVLSSTVQGYHADASQDGQSLSTAKHAGNIIEGTVLERLSRSQHTNCLRRFDVADESDISDAAMPLARTADVFVVLRPKGQSNEPKGLIDSLLFGAGRHLLLVPDDRKAIAPFENIVVAWNGSRESARALAEALPYLRQASRVRVLVMHPESWTQADPLRGNDAVLHLRYHGINAVKYHAVAEEDEIAETLIAECREFDAHLLVMGSYSHSRLHDLLPGGTTDRVLHRLPIPLLIAH